MPRVLVVAVAFALCLVACGRKIEDKDLVGTWTVDPAAVAGKDTSDFFSSINYNLNPDHSFIMSGSAPITVKGNWSFSNMKLTMTPATLGGPNPVDPTSPMDMPIGPAIENLRAAGQDKSLVDALETLGQATILDVSPDGKKLTDAGKPAMIKTS